MANAGDSLRGVNRSVQIGSELIKPGILLGFPFSMALEAAEEESSIVRDCGGSFGYVFYVMQKPGL